MSNTPTAAATPAEVNPTDDFKNAVDLLGIVKVCSTRLTELKVGVDEEITALFDDIRSEWSEHEARRTEAEAAIIVLAQRNPQWFAKAKTVSTLYGQIQSRKTTSHEVTSESETIRRIKDRQLLATVKNDQKEILLLSGLIRKVEEVDLEHCAKLPVELLEELGINRSTDESITVKPASADLGKAMKASDTAPAEKAEKAEPPKEKGRKAKKATEAHAAV